MPKRYIALLLAFVALHLALILVISPSQAALDNLGVNIQQLRFINLTLVMFLAIIWFAAFYGYAKFKGYALKIINSPDGRAFNTLANGLGVLAFALPISSLISGTLRYVAQVNPEYTAATVITNRYIALGLSALAIIYIYKGSKALVALTGKRLKSRGYWWSVVAVLAVSGIHAYIALSNTASTVPDPATGQAIYYLPGWLIIMTNIIPHGLIWFFGLKSIALILFFKRNTKALVYEHALKYFAIGLGLVVGGSIVVQIFTALGNAPASWGLQLLLVFVYLLILVMAIGYILIAIGAKKLKKIEEV